MGREEGRGKGEGEEGTWSREEFLFPVPSSLFPLFN
jgi:hypothetical protein